MALVALSVVEQRLDAVRAVLAGATVTEVATVEGAPGNLSEFREGAISRDADL
jgi:hypothetical protein